MNGSKKAQAAVFTGTGKPLEIRDFDLPEPQGGEVLVRVLGCTLCGSDLHTRDGRRETPLPTVLGHEIVGEVVACGESAPKYDLAGEDLRSGDRVTWAIVANCGGCFYCRRGLPQKCAGAVKYGHEPLAPGRELTGGLATHCLLLPGTAVVRLPEKLPLAAACPASCATATVAAALAAAGEVRERHVVVFGLGMLGLTASAMLRSQGADSIVCVDISPARAELARKFGATHVVMPDALPDLGESITGGYGFDVMLELSGSPAAFELGWPQVRKGGQVVLVGSVFPAPPVAISLEEIVRRNLTLRGIHNYTPGDLLRGVQFLTEHHHEFPFSELVGRWFPLADADEAFQAGSTGTHIRVGVHP